MGKTLYRFLERETRTRYLTMLISERMFDNLNKITKKLGISKNELINSVLENACYTIFERELKEEELK